MGDCCVWKYQVSPTTVFTLDLPVGARVLTVATQGEDVFLWALVDPNAVAETRRFLVVATGERFNAGLPLFFYIGTFFVEKYVFHLFEEL